MQVRLNLTPSKMPFKAPRNNADELDPVIFTADGKQKYWFNPENK